MTAAELAAVASDHGGGSSAPEREPVVVVGAGVIGLLAALACLDAGAAVTVLDAGPIPNPAAASFDQHRIVRALHPGDPPATRRALAAQRAWRELAARLDAALFQPTGVLTVLRPDEAAAARALLDAAGGLGELLGPAELAGRWPHLRFPAGAAGVLEPDAGVVLADRALGALADRLAAHPRARLRPHDPAVGLDSAAGTVRLGGGRALRGRILVTAGAWSQALLPVALAAELTLYRQSLLYCEVPLERRARWARTPAVLGLDPVDGCWLVPPVAGTQLKLTAASACRAVDAPAGSQTPPGWRAHLVERFAGRLAGFDAGWVREARDDYYLADTATGGARLLALGGGAAAVWAHAACGGGAFKFAPLIARSLAEAALAVPGAGDG